MRITLKFSVFAPKHFTSLPLGRKWQGGGERWKFPGKGSALSVKKANYCKRPKKKEAEIECARGMSAKLLFSPFRAATRKVLRCFLRRNFSVFPTGKPRNVHTARRRERAANSPARKTVSDKQWVERGVVTANGRVNVLAAYKRAISSHRYKHMQAPEARDRTCLKFLRNMWK